MLLCFVAGRDRGVRLGRIRCGRGRGNFHFVRMRDDPQMERLVAIMSV